MGQLKPIQRPQPTEEQKEITMECATLLASVAYDIGSVGCQIQLHNVRVNGVGKGDWRVTIERVG